MGRQFDIHPLQGFLQMLNTTGHRGVTGARPHVVLQATATTEIRSCSFNTLNVATAQSDNVLNTLL
jgi:hypothetical protein